MIQPQELPAHARDGNQVSPRLARRVALMLLAIGAIAWALLWIWDVPGTAILKQLTPGSMALGIFGGIGFIACKSLSIQYAAAAASVKLSFDVAVRLFTQGVLVESVTWPGKAWADSFRTLQLRRHTGISLLHAAGVTMAARTGAIGASSVMVGFAAATLVLNGQWTDDAMGRTQLGGAAAVGCIAVGVGVWCIARKRAQLAVKLKPGAAVRMVLAACAASAFDVAGLCTICALICGADPWSVAPAYVLLSGVAAASTLPMGAGVLDAGLYALLTTRLGVDQPSAVAAVLCYRVCGPGLTIAVGGVTSMVRVGAAVTDGALAKIGKRLQLWTKDAA